MRVLKAVELSDAVRTTLTKVARPRHAGTCGISCYDLLGRGGGTAERGIAADLGCTRGTAGGGAPVSLRPA